MSLLDGRQIRKKLLFYAWISLILPYLIFVLLRGRVFSLPFMPDLLT